jgi:hypothetical protein
MGSPPHMRLVLENSRTLSFLVGEALMEITTHPSQRGGIYPRQHLGPLEDDDPKTEMASEVPQAAVA